MRPDTHDAHPGGAAPVHLTVVRSITASTAPREVSGSLRATPGTWTATVTLSCHDADGVSELEFRAGTEAP
jgi:hypothetical protein